MNVVEWLDDVRKLDYMVDNLILRKEEIRTLATKISSGQDDGMPHASGMSDKVGNLVAKLVDMEEDISRAIDRYVDHKTEVCRQLEKLPAKQYQILYLHYIRYKSWSEVADEIGYGFRQVRRIKNEGLKNLSANVLECPHDGVV